MGWRFKVGATRACKIENGVLMVDSVPEPLTFPTTLPFDIEWQHNMFLGGGICFVLVSEETQRICVGQESGSILLLTFDGIFAGIAQWEVPLLGMDLKQIGYFSERRGIYETYASPLDPYWIHAGRRSILLDAPLPRSVLFEDFEDIGANAWNLSQIVQNASVLSSGFDEDQKTASSGKWTVDPPEDSYPYLVLGEEW